MPLSPTCNVPALIVVAGVARAAGQNQSACAVLTQPRCAGDIDSMRAVTPVPASMTPVERLTVPPVSVTVPSSKPGEAAFCVPLTVTVYVPVASVPAAKTALCEAPGQIPVATSPLALALQLAVAPSHVPPGVAPPAPAVAPSISHDDSVSHFAPTADAQLVHLQDGNPRALPHEYALDVVAAPGGGVRDAVGVGAVAGQKTRGQIDPHPRFFGRDIQRTHDQLCGAQAELVRCPRRRPGGRGPLAKDAQVVLCRVDSIGTNLNFAGDDRRVACLKTSALLFSEKKNAPVVLFTPVRSLTSSRNE